MQRTSSCQSVVVEQKGPATDQVNVLEQITSRTMHRRRRSCESLLTIIVVCPLIVALVSSPVEPIPYK